MNHGRVLQTMATKNWRGDAADGVRGDGGMGAWYAFVRLSFIRNSNLPRAGT